MEQTFHKPSSVDEAVRILRTSGEAARPLSGGATLVAMMNAGLMEPSALVSLDGIEELRECRREADGTVRIGAMRRHRQTAFESELVDAQQVVSAAAARIANVPVRNMGTIGGSVAFADPAADYPPALVAAGARIEIAGPEGRREVPAEEFFHGWYETALEADEIVTAVLVPAASSGSVGWYEKLTRVSGDFAIASVALCVAFDEGSISALRIAIGGCGGGPVRVAEAEEMLLGSRSDAQNLRAAGALIVAELDPVDDVRASANYRRLVVPRMLAAALDSAARLPKGKP